MYIIGLDAGSVSVKGVIIDGSGIVLRREHRIHRGHPLSAAVEAELRNLYQNKYPNENVDWVQATDHCINRTNKGACECAKTDAAIFQWMEKGLYKITLNN